MTNLYTQLEAAFNYRGNVTLTLKNGEAIVCFLFNRELNSQEPFVEVFLTGSGNYHKYAISELADIQLTGEDHAAGKSYQEWLAKQNAETH